jgi:hypothetical protein
VPCADGKTSAAPPGVAGGGGDSGPLRPAAARRPRLPPHLRIPGPGPLPRAWGRSAYFLLRLCGISLWKPAWSTRALVPRSGLPPRRPCVAGALCPRRRSHCHAPLYTFYSEPLYRKYTGCCIHGFTIRGRGWLGGLADGEHAVLRRDVLRADAGVARPAAGQHQPWAFRRHLVLYFMSDSPYQIY